MHTSKDDRSECIECMAAEKKRKRDTNRGESEKVTYQKKFFRKFSWLAIIVEQFDFDHIDCVIGWLQNALKLEVNQYRRFIIIHIYHRYDQ